MVKLVKIEIVPLFFYITEKVLLYSNILTKLRRAGTENPTVTTQMLKDSSIGTYI